MAVCRIKRCHASGEDGRNDRGFDMKLFLERVQLGRGELKQTCMQVFEGTFMQVETCVCVSVKACCMMGLNMLVSASGGMV